jgi:putative ABC transport system permease protein
MRPVTLAYLYVRRLRTHPVQELLAGAGIAIAVALTCAVQIANHSVTGSARQTVQDIGGSAAVQVTARSAEGFDQQLVQRVRAVRGVRRATGLLEQRGVLVGPHRRQAPVHVIGADLRPAELGGLLRSRLSIATVVLRRGIVLPQAVADKLGIETGGDRIGRALPKVELDLRGRAVAVETSGIPPRNRVGSFADSQVTVMPLSQLQRIARLPGRITRVLIQPHAGAKAAVQKRLAALFGRRLSVGTPADELRVLQQATNPSDRASAFFTIIAAAVGWLLAFNAMLLSAPERRRVIAELRIQGFRGRQLVQIAIFQALVLGIVAAAIGVVIGQLLARSLLEESTDYLAGAFSFGTQAVVPVSALVLSFTGGVVATCLAAAPPLLALRQRNATADAYRDAGETGQALGPGIRRRLALGALGVFAATELLLLTASAEIVAISGLALALLLAVPALFAAVARAARWAGAHAGRSTMVALGFLVLQASTLRSLALAATAALAVFGSVAIGNARHDLLYGISRFSQQYADSADLWVVHPADDQATKDFPIDGLVGRLARLPGIATVRRCHGGYLDIAGRRVWVMARAATVPQPVPSVEVVTGDSQPVAMRLRAGGWLTISDELARSLGVKPGDMLALPAPTGTTRFRVAATTTNFGWSSGAIVIGARDYRRAWANADATGLELDLRKGFSPAATLAAVRRALGPHSALEVQTAGQRAAQATASAREGLARLGQIAGLLIFGAALAMAAAMSAAIWQRRSTLAALRLQGLRPAQLWRMVLAESATIVLTGCFCGALAGIYGQFLVDRYLRLTTGFPAPFTPAGRPVSDALLLAALTLAGIAIPGYLAARAPAHLGLREETT